MKKRLLLVCALGIAMCVFYACMKDSENDSLTEQNERSFPDMRKAQAFFNRENEKLSLPNPLFNTPQGHFITRSGMPFDFYLEDGLIPLWDNYRAYTYGDLNIIEVPVKADNGVYYDVAIRENLSLNRYYADPDMRLLIFENISTKEMYSRVVTFLPDPEYPYTTAHLYYALVDTDYSGVLIYSEPGSAPICGARYVDGTLEGAFEFPKEPEEIKLVSDLVNSISLAPVYEWWINPDGSIGGPLEIGNVVIRDKKLSVCFFCQSNPCRCWGPSIVSMITDELICHYGGGGGPAPADRRPKERDIEEDCDGKSKEMLKDMGDLVDLINKIAADKIGDTECITFEYFKETIDGSGIEYSTTVIDHGYRQVLSPIIAGSANNVTLDWDWTGSVGTIHSHPQGTPPSAMDIIKTGEIAGKKSSYHTTAIYSSSGIFYMIYITDHKKAAAFNEKYKSQVDPLTNWFIPGSELDKFLNERNDFGNFSKNEMQMYQLTDILNNYDSGMRLAKVFPTGDSEAYGVTKKAGEKFKTATKCKNTWTASKPELYPNPFPSPFS